MPDYDKVGLLALRGSRVLLCRKKHSTSLLILPGGCREVGETSEQCLRRELKEELGPVRVEDLAWLGVYESPAAGAIGKVVRIELYSGTLLGEPAASSEIRELVWFGPEDNPEQLAPSLRHFVFPDLIRRGILSSAFTIQ
jgi:ADP-ribose pyrophosphatase YjhB (NUDIX family)